MANVVNIRVVASADGSLRSVFRPFEEGAESARRKSGASTDAAAKQAEKNAKYIQRVKTASMLAEQRAEEQAQKQGARAAETMARQTARQAEAAANARKRAEEKAAQAALKAAEKAAEGELKARKKVVDEELKLFDKKLNAKKKALEAEEREIIRTAERAEQRERRQAEKSAALQSRFREHMVRDFGGRAVNNIGSLARGAIGVAGQMAQGAGVDFSLGGMVQRNVELERRSTELSNAGYDPNDPTKKRMDPGAVRNQIAGAADATGFDRLTTAEGLQKFVGKTGELELGLKMIKDIGVLAKASGSDMGDLADAAGDVANSFEHVKDKGERAKVIQQTMRVIAGQGKIGAVEMKDLASGMAKLATSANKFEGGRAENIGIMGALVQMSRKSGGSASASQAATSVQSFVNTLQTPARMKQFAAAGVTLRDPTTGVLKNPQQIIEASLSASGGDAAKFKKMWANVQGGRAVEGFADVYRSARASSLQSGGSKEAANEAGLQAVRAEFAKYKNVAMGEGEIKDSFNARMGNKDSQVQVFNNKLDDIAQEASDKLMPALEKLAPKIVAAAEAFGKFVVWAADNPGKALAAALSASVAKAGIETVLRGSFEKLMDRALGGGGAGAAGKSAASGAGLGALGTGLAIAAAAVTITAAGVTLIDQAFKDKEDAAAKAQADANMSAADRANAIVGAGSDPASQTKALGELGMQEEKLKAQIAAAEAAKSNAPSALSNALGITSASSALNWMSAGSLGKSGDAVNAEAGQAANLDNLKAELAKTSEASKAMATKLNSTLTVHVANMPAGGGPFVDGSGRTNWVMVDGVRD